MVDGLDGVALLVDRSLLRREDHDDSEPRFWLLETIREFGQEQLEATEEAPLTRHRHAAYYLSLAEDAAPRLYTDEQRTWLARLGREHPNLRAALTWSRSQPETLELGARLTAALGWFWWLHGDWSEGRQSLEAVERSAAEDPQGRVSWVVRARALNRAAHLARGQGDYDRAKALAEQGLRHAHHAGDRREIAWSRLARAAVALDQVEFEYGVELSNEAVTIGRQLGDAWVTALGLYFLGFMTRGRGDFDRATAFHQESLALRRRGGDAWGISWSVHDLGLVALEQGDHRRARRLLEEGLALHRELNHRRGIGWSLNDLGVAALATGNLDEARALLHESLTVRREQGDKRGIAEGLATLAGLARAQGHAPRAARLLAAATALREVIGVTLWPIERDRYDREVAAVRSALAEAAFSAAWAEGRAMPPEDAIAYALASEGSEAEPDGVAGLVSPGRGADPLTAREREVAALVARGRSNRQIADLLVIGRRTAENHVAHICNKLGVNSRAQIAAWAVQRGLLADGSSASAAREPPNV
jgi:non-specific serine/threonine protein kinase